MKKMRFLGILLSISLMLGLVPGLSLTAYAATETYTKLMNDKTVVKFNNHDWYIIADDSTATGGTVTLLAADTSFGTSAFDSTSPYSNDYSSSTVNSMLVALTAEGGAFASVKDAIVNTDLTDVGVTGGKLYLLSKSEAQQLSPDVLKMSFSSNVVLWWLRSPGNNGSEAAVVDGMNGYAGSFGSNVGGEFGVRPALQLDLSKVTFDSTSNTFSVGSSSVAVTGLTLKRGDTEIDGTQEIEVGESFALTAVISPEEATDKTVLWSVGGTNAGAVTLYSDAECTAGNEVGTEATSTLTVYAKGIAAGTATVTVASNADSTKSASCDVTVNAALASPYAGLVNTTTVVKFHNYNWYIIADNSTAADAGTVTLLAADTSFGTSAFDSTPPYSNAYSGSTVKSKLDALTAEGGAFASVKNAIADTNLSDVGVTGAKLYLLSKSEAEPYANFNFTGARDGNWWLRSPGNNDESAAFVDGQNGRVYGDGDRVDWHFGVRPALKLNLASVIFSSQSNTFSLKPAGYNVTITAGSNMTKTTDSGAASQTGLSGAMTDVVYTANDGYYFPTDYSVAEVSGIKVTRDSYTQIIVSGTPSADATITLTAPTAKTTPDAPATASATGCTTSDNNDGKLTGVTTAMEYKKSDADSWTAGTGNDITGLVPGTYYVRVKATDTTLASDNQELTIKGFISYTVTFKVVNGKWNEGEGDAATADKTVTLTGHDGDTLKLTADQIPAVGTKPNDTYKAGSWDVTPSTETEITADTTYTYTYAQKDSISQTVTFKVVNGKWDDDSTADKTVTLTGYEGDTLKLAANQIPAVGTKPNDTYKAGSWNVTPSAETEITEATTYTYTYAQKDTISRTVTFKVVNGSWNDETTTDKTVTLTGYEGDTLKLAAADIPAVGTKPSDTYKAGSWDVMPSTETAITEATTYTYTYAQKDSISQTVTFMVVNGSWNDETTTDKTVTLTGYEGDTLKLAAADIPAVGTKPSDTYKAGSWDVTPSTETEITAATTYTYTYVAKEAAAVTKAPEGKTLTYNGQEQALVTAGEATGGEMQYALGTKDAATQPYTTSIPAKTDAGTYYVWYKVKGDGSHSDTQPKCIEVTINPADYSSAVSNKALSFTGQPQPLVTAGTVEGGTLEYALGTDANTAPADGWSTEIPTATEAGTYYVWYRIKGDANHNDVAPACIVVTIAEPTSQETPAATPAAPESVSDYTLLASMKTSGKKAFKLKWTAVTGAEGYDVFFGRVGKKAKLKTSVNGTSCKIKKLKRGIAYKAFVKAWKTENGQKVYIGKASPDMHAVAGGKTKRYTNPKKITVKKKNLTVAVGGSKKIKASLKKLSSSRRYLNHTAKIRYFSSNRAVATVNAKGKVTGVAPGTCTVYAVAENGLRKGVKITVK